MKRKRYSVEAIVAAVKQQEMGVSAADIARKLSIAEQTFYGWKKQYGGLEAAEVLELKQLREENASLKRLVADLSLDKVMLHDIAEKMVGASQRRSAVSYLQRRYSVSERRGCQVTGSHRSTHRYSSARPSQAALRQRIRDLARSRIRYGYKRIHILLKREDIHVNKKRVHRLYCEEGLQIWARRPRRHVSAVSRQPPRTKPQAPNVPWSMDFVSDQTASGLWFRALTVVDVFTRECLAIKPGQSLVGTDVVNVLNRIVTELGAPKRLHGDNVRNFPGAWWIYGPMGTRSRWSFRGQASRRTMPSSSHSTAHSGMSA